MAAAPQSMEQSTLHTMINERDSQISSLLHQLHSISDNISSLQKELHNKSQARKHQREEHSAAIKKLKEEHAEQRAHLASYESKIKGGGGLRVHEYAALMKAANKDVESSYVIRLQAQLCRAMHSLGVMESQLALVKENCSSLIKCMKEDLSHMVDDRTRREIELMNTLATVDAEKRAWQADMEKKLREQEDLLDSVRDEYEELGLEYDEEEVRRALEMQMLQEQVERVKNEKILAEKDLLAALLEREDQIGKLKDEIAGLDGTLKELKGENGEAVKDSDRKTDTIGAESEESTNKTAANDNKKPDSEAAEAETNSTVVNPEEGTAVEEKADSTTSQMTQDLTLEIISDNQTQPDEEKSGNLTSEEKVNENMSELTSNLEDTTIEEGKDSVEDVVSSQNAAHVAEDQIDSEKSDEPNKSDTPNADDEAMKTSESVEPVNDEETIQSNNDDNSAEATLDVLEAAKPTNGEVEENLEETSAVAENGSSNASNESKDANDQ